MRGWQRRRCVWRGGQLQGPVTNRRGATDSLGSSLCLPLLAHLLQTLREEVLKLRSLQTHLHSRRQSAAA